MKKFRAWVRKNKKTIIIADLVMLLAVAGVLIATSSPAKVEGLTVAGSTYSTADLSWNGAKNAKGYRIYRAVGDGKFEYLDYTADTSYTDKDLFTGRNYSYAVVSRNGFLSSDINSAEKVSVVPSLTDPVLEIDTSNGVMELKFADVDGAIGYEIIRNGEVLDKIRDNNYIDTDAISDVDYNYEVRAFRYVKKPVYSNFSNTAAGVLHAVQNFNVKTVENELVFTWTKSDYYKTYKLFDGDNVLTETGDGYFSIADYKLDNIYDIKLIGYADDGSQSPENARRFIVTEAEMTNEDARLAACEWAVSIANDNSFTYGTGKRAHNYGCYFCGTNVGPNMNKKGKSKVSGHSYAKTYCCNPFVHACYAHGAGDPNMLNACRHGKGVGFSAQSFTKYGNWKKVGKPGLGNLQKGDVLCLSAHVCIYIGDGRVAHAMSEGWGAGSITTSKASGMYKRAKFVMRYTGNGRGTKLIIQDVDENGNPIEENTEAA